MPDRHFSDYSQSVSGLLNRAKLDNSQRTSFIFESRIALFEHRFQVAGAGSAMELALRRG